MKLRIDPNRIRFRLSQTELDGLIKTGYIVEGLSIDGKESISYSVSGQDDLSKIQLKLENSTLKLLVPKNDLLSLIEGSPSKNGVFRQINFDNGDKTVSLQVDLSE